MSTLQTREIKILDQCLLLWQISINLFFLLWQWNSDHVLNCEVFLSFYKTTPAVIKKDYDITFPINLSYM